MSFPCLRTCLLLGCLGVLPRPGLGFAQSSSDAGAVQESPSAAPAVRQSLNDAWWTGPMLANSAGTLPQGHALVEPYVYDVTAAHSNGFGSLAYLLYGITDRLTAGLTPTIGYNKVSGGPSSSGVGFGDLTVQAQYRFAQFHPGGWMPTASLNLQETLPTGKYDQLGDRPSDGFGAGAYTTSVGLYTQTYFWLPDSRLLRMRFNVSQSFSSDVTVRDASVYGTSLGFHGRAQPGSASYVDASWEYSLTRGWVLALDATYRHTGGARVSGYDSLDDAQNPLVRLNPGASDVFGFAPAVEYSWTANLGVLVGARFLPATHNTTASVTPAVALNMFL